MNRHDRSHTCKLAGRPAFARRLFVLSSTGIPSRPKLPTRATILRAAVKRGAGHALRNMRSHSHLPNRDILMTIGVQLDSAQFLELRKRERRRRANANLLLEYVQSIASMPLYNARQLIVAHYNVGPVRREHPSVEFKTPNGNRPSSRLQDEFGISILHRLQNRSPGGRSGPNAAKFLG